jgi:hypothetical protein
MSLDLGAQAGNCTYRYNMNWSIFSITLMDNISSLFSFLELIVTILYFLIAFLNMLVDTSETFGVLVLVVFVTLHQFNLLVSVHNSSKLSKLYVHSNNSNKISLVKLYLSAYIFSIMHKF